MRPSAQPRSQEVEGSGTGNIGVHERYAVGTATKPMKVEAGSRSATPVKVTVIPLKKAKAQVAPQSSPTGTEVITPLLRAVLDDGQGAG